MWPSASKHCWTNGSGRYTSCHRCRGVPHSTITSIFERNTSPTIPTLEAIRKGFHIPLA